MKRVGVAGRTATTRTMRPADSKLRSAAVDDQYLAPIAMRTSDLCPEVSGESSDLEVGGPKRQEARAQEERHGLLLSPQHNQSLANKPERAW